GTPIKIAEFNNRVTHILRQQQIPVVEAYQMGLIKNLLTNEIFEILVKKDAARLGIRIEDRIIAEQIKTLIAPYKSATVNDRDALKKFLEIQGMSEKQLVATLRDELTSRILKSTLSSASYVPDALLSDLQAYHGMTKNLEVIFTPNSSITLKEQPSDAELQSYYQERSAGFMNPESRDVTVAVLDSSKIAKPVVTDADIKAFFDENHDQFSLPASVDVEQSLLDDEAKAKAVADAVKAGTSMADAVKQVTGHEQAFQGKNNLSKDGLPSEIATPVFAAKAGDVIGPVKSALGYHVIRLLALKEAQTASFDSVKDKIRKELEDEKSGNAVYDVTGDIEDRLANGETYEALTKDYPLTLTSLKALKKDAKATSWTDKEFQIILTKAFGMKDATPSEMTDLSPNKLYSVRVDKISPAMAKPFAEVKADILKKWTDDQQSQQNLLAAQKRVDDLIAGKIQFTTLNPSPIHALSHAGNTALAKDVTERFMAAEKGKFILAISRDKNGIYIGRVTDVSLPQENKIDDASRKTTEANIADAGYMAYMESLQTKYPVTINDALLARTYGKTTNTAE
ncbi:MAG TPA: hypothetical protein DCM27_06420, partial [Rhodospirillaceae bacterium]|nr:hypothetical protein [Rhodospirillaceae bacterium]